MVVPARAVVETASAGGWTRQANLQQQKMKRIRGQRLGVVGVGRIGTAVILRAKAFGFALSFYDPGLPAGAEKGLGVARADSFEELVAGSDAITFHCPYSASSRHLPKAGNMPPAGTGLVVVNCARGGLIEEAALIDALASVAVRGAALDCLEGEPTPAIEPLLAAQRAGANLLLTPHSAFYSDEAFTEMRHLAAREVRRVLLGEPPNYQVN